MITATGRRWRTTPPPYQIPTEPPYNVPQYLTTPTEDGSGSTVHPCVLDFGPNGWRGLAWQLRHADAQPRAAAGRAGHGRARPALDAYPGCAAVPEAATGPGAVALAGALRRALQHEVLAAKHGLARGNPR